jgi:hypothetical protein
MCYSGSQSTGASHVAETSELHSARLQRERKLVRRLSQCGLADRDFEVAQSFARIPLRRRYPTSSERHDRRK